MQKSNDFRWFRPQMVGAHFRDRVIAFVGATVAILLTFALCSFFDIGAAGMPAIVAPLGASAVMVFVVPSSPLAQPWRVIGGNVVSALVGTLMFHVVPNLMVAAALAVGTAILAMTVLRCVHPPGGAAALTAVIGGPAVHHAGFAYALAPMGVNTVILVVLALLFHRLTGHSYPHRAAREQPGTTAAFEPEDIDRALADLHETFDISRADLEQLLSRAEQHAIERRRAAG